MDETSTAATGAGREPLPAAERDTLGMSQNELFAFLDELLQEEASEAAAASGRSVEQELASTGFAAARAASTYAVHLIAANNAFLSRHLIDLGLLTGVDATPPTESLE